MSLVQAVVNLIPVAIDWIVRSLALATPVALWYRFWWGSKSQVSFRQLPDPRDRYWSYGSTDGDHWWGNYAHVIAVNRGWWTGLLWDITLEEVTFDDNQTVTEACDETVKIEIDTYAEGESERIDLGNPHQRVERSIPGEILHISNSHRFCHPMATSLSTQRNPTKQNLSLSPKCRITSGLIQYPLQSRWTLAMWILTTEGHNRSEWGVSPTSFGPSKRHIASLTTNVRAYLPLYHKLFMPSTLSD